MSQESSKKGRKISLSPTIATILIALVGLLGTGIGAYLQGWSAEGLERKKFEYDMIRDGLKIGSREETLKYFILLKDLKLLQREDMLIAIDSLTEKPEKIPSFASLQSIPRSISYEVLDDKIVSLILKIESNDKMLYHFSGSLDNKEFQSSSKFGNTVSHTLGIGKDLIYSIMPCRLDITNVNAETSQATISIEIIGGREVQIYTNTITLAPSMTERESFFIVFVKNSWKSR